VAPYSLQDVEEKKLMYLDDGREFIQGQEPRYQYAMISIEGFDRLDFGDVNDVKVEIQMMDPSRMGMVSESLLISGADMVD